LAAATILIGLCLGFAACGGDEESGSTVVPAAGEYAQTTSAGDASWNVTAGDWLDRSSGERLATVEDYVAGNEDVCGDAAPERVRDYAEVSAGADYPLTAPVDELFAEGCAAVLQS
jgi:hypothetical protein